MGKSIRKDRLIKEYIHDPYFTKEKYHDPSVCKSVVLFFTTVYLNGLSQFRRMLKV